MNAYSYEQFDGRATDYAVFRPDYPASLLTILREQAGFDSSSVVADLGSGTGLFAKLFVDNGNRVYGVEPNDEMRAQALQLMHGMPRFTAVKGTAERTTLLDRSVDVIACGQSFHLFYNETAFAEFARVLRAPGCIVLAAYRVSDYADYYAGYADLVATYASDPRNARPARPEDHSKYYRRLRELFAGDVGYVRMSRHIDQTLEQFLGQLFSISYLPDRRDPAADAMSVDAERLFHAHAADGLLRAQYVLDAFYCTRFLAGVRHNPRL